MFAGKIVKQFKPLVDFSQSLGVVLDGFKVLFQVRHTLTEGYHRFIQQVDPRLEAGIILGQGL